MGEDKYKNFGELVQEERRGTTFQTKVLNRNSAIAVVAPHGGYIEPGTSQIAKAIAGEDCNLYLFEALKSKGASNLHVTSSNYDDPDCLQLVSGCDVVVGIHGMKGKEDLVRVGGLDDNLRKVITAQLNLVGFPSELWVLGKKFSGRSPSNICNLGQRRQGVQLEISRSLRDKLVTDESVLSAFSETIRSAIGQLGSRALKEN